MLDLGFELGRVADTFCPHCGGTSVRLGGYCCCENCGYQFPLPRLLTKSHLIRPSLRPAKPRQKSRVKYTYVEEAQDPIGRGLTRNPYALITCYHCKGIAHKNSPDTYYCPNCQRTLPAAYPHDWFARRRRVFQRDHQRCTTCGRDLHAQEKHCEHIIPVRLGGSHADANLRTLCYKCHLDLHPDREVYFWGYRDYYSRGMARSSPPPFRTTPLRMGFHPRSGGPLSWIPLVLVLLVTLVFIIS